MKVRLLLMAAVVCGFVLVQATAGGGDKKKEEPAFKKPMPGPEHKVLTRLKGTFNGKVTDWFTGKPVESTAVTKRTVVMDGLYLQENHTGQFFGAKFKGMGILGYDTAKKKYIMSWIDNFGTGIQLAEGSYDPTKKILTWTGEENSPEMGKMKMRDVLTIISDDEQRLEMYRTPVAKKGGELKVMEILYTRAPAVKKKKAG